MARHNHQAGQSEIQVRRQWRNRELDQALHQSIFAHLTRAVADPDRPGQQISWSELDQRLRGRAYRQAAHASLQAARR